MSIVTREKLLEAGVQFGHQTKRWNPKMRKYIFGQRNGIHIIDLQKTMRKLDETYNYVKELSANGKKILFVGTKKQAKQAIQDGALKTNSPYVTERWLGGLLTNFEEIKKNIKDLINIENREKSGEIKLLPKKEQLQIAKQKEDLENKYGGIRNMYKLPDAVFVSDIITNNIAVKEAVKLNIPVIAICDSNSDPDNISYIIPGNDDATKSITLITNIIVQAIVDGKKSQGIILDDATIKLNLNSQTTPKPEEKQQAQKQDEQVKEKSLNSNDSNSNNKEEGNHKE